MASGTSAILAAVAFQVIICGSLAARADHGCTELPRTLGLFMGLGCESPGCGCFLEFGCYSIDPGDQETEIRYARDDQDGRDIVVCDWERRTPFGRQNPESYLIPHQGLYVDDWDDKGCGNGMFKTAIGVNMPGAINNEYMLEGGACVKFETKRSTDIALHKHIAQIEMQCLQGKYQYNSYTHNCYGFVREILELAAKLEAGEAQ